jgi:hypothetical protein
VSAALVGAVIALAVISTPRISDAAIKCRSDTGWCTYIDRAHGWTVRWPTGWRLQPYAGRCPDGSSGRTLAFWGAVISNLSRDLTHPAELPGACDRAWDYRTLPPALVVIDFRHPSNPASLAEGSAAGSPGTPTPFPWSLDGAEVLSRTSGPTWGEPQPTRRLAGMIGKETFVGTVVFGAGASAADRGLAAKVVASVSPS